MPLQLPGAHANPCHEATGRVHAEQLQGYQWHRELLLKTTEASDCPNWPFVQLPLLQSRPTEHPRMSTLALRNDGHSNVDHAISLQCAALPIHQLRKEWLPPPSQGP